LESQWRVVDSHSAAVCCCSRPMVGVLYKSVPVLADEDKIGGSVIKRLYVCRSIVNDAYERHNHEALLKT